MLWGDLLWGVERRVGVDQCNKRNDLRSVPAAQSQKATPPMVPSSAKWLDSQPPSDSAEPYNDPAVS